MEDNINKKLPQKKSVAEIQTFVKVMFGVMLGSWKVQREGKILMEK